MTKREAVKRFLTWGPFWSQVWSGCLQPLLAVLEPDGWWVKAVGIFATGLHKPTESLQSGNKVNV